MARRAGWKHQAAPRGVLRFDPGATSLTSARNRYIQRFGSQAVGAVSRPDPGSEEVVVSFVLTQPRYTQEVIRKLRGVVGNAEDVRYLTPGVPVQLVVEEGFTSLLPFLLRVGDVTCVRGRLGA